MFALSHASVFFDYFRIPHRVGDVTRPELPASWGAASWDGAEDGRHLYWLRSPEADRRDATRPARHQVGDIVIFGRVVPTDVARHRLERIGPSWRPTTPTTDADGSQVGAIWRDERGSVFLPFDPDEVIRNYWSEAYTEIGGTRAKKALARVARTTYYAVRGLIPRRVQIAMRRSFSKVQARATFPRWPAEPALHDFYELLFDVVAEVTGEDVPWIAPWPEQYRWALVVTHDVETRDGLDDLDRLRTVERALGYRSSWNFVPKRYDVDDAVVADLEEDGCEVGVHGLYHDGRDLGSLRLLRKRLPEMQAHARRWHATGFRSPATQRVWEWMPMLGFDYDSSYPDTDLFEPQPGGCCTWLPFLNGQLVELPITLSQDHTLFVILGQTDETAWVEKAELLRDRGGLALLNTHPDYMRDPERLRAYEAFLRRFADDASAWRALPRDVASWWRRRAASHLELRDGAWCVVGPAAREAQVAYARPGLPREHESAVA